jgi:hypothetical protein
VFYTGFLPYKYFSILSKLDNFKNPLDLDDGDFNIIRNITTPKEFKWVKSRGNIYDVGVLGFECGRVRLDYKYVAIVGERLNDDMYKDHCNFDIQEGLAYIAEQKKLGKLNEIKFNGELLESLLKGLNPLCSYSMAFLVYHVYEGGYRTLGKHYLVNNTTNAFELIQDVYKNFEKLTVRYEFVASDNLIIRY